MRDVLRTCAAAIVVAVLFLGPTMTRAQEPGRPGEQGGQAAPQEPGTPAAPAQAMPKAAIERWFDLQAASFMARFRRVETGQGTVTHNHLQDSVALRGRFKLDERANYTMNFAIGTGSTFTSGWNNTGVGLGGGRVTNLYLKQFFVAAAPVAGVQFSAGGLGFVRGDSTEITTYDNDGFLVGERLSVMRPARLYLDEIAFTNAYLGDYSAPSVVRRLKRLDEANYQQLLGLKRFGKWLAVSGDYTRASGIGTGRVAVEAWPRRLRVLDHVQIEQYRRGGSDAAFGFAAFAEKTVGRAIARVGYADIDARYGGLNADKFNSGRRWYAQSDFALTGDLTTWVCVSHALHNDFVVPIRTRVDVVLTYNAMGPLRRAGLFH